MEFKSIITILFSILFSVVAFVFSQLWMNVNSLNDKINQVENIALQNTENIKDIVNNISNLRKDQNEIEIETKEHKHCK
jgi:predicted PurR-regulated permease PerM